MSFDVFLSYSHADRQFVDKLARGIDALGLKVFRDSTSLAIYDKLDSKLKQNVIESKYVCAVISPSYLRSYWCLFEAIEALQMQDFDLKFLPIVLEHNPEDQTIDETFVLQALADIRIQRQKLEAEIIEHKAFSLSSKLEKLSFVQDRLPRVFESIQNRIYPKFPLWDEEAVSKAMKDFFEFLSPGNSSLAIPVLDGLQSVRNESTPKFRPQLEPLPLVLWRTKVGIQGWRNKPIVTGRDVFVSSAGSAWNEPDDLDGINCLDIETGDLKWFGQTKGDANEMLLAKGLITVGTDAGELAAFSATNGRPVWRNTFGSAIVSGPLRLPMKHMSSSGRVHSGNHSESRLMGDRALVCHYDGTVRIVELDTGKTVEAVSLGHPIIGKASIFRLSGGNSSQIFIPHVGSLLTVMTFMPTFAERPILLDHKKISTVNLAPFVDEGADGYAASLTEIVSIVDADPNVIIGFARDTYANKLPALLLSKLQLQPVWSSHDSAFSVGNLRASPAIHDGCALLAPAYSSGLLSIELETGKTRKFLDFGNDLYEQWSTPVCHAGSVYLGRIDGFLHKVDLDSGALDWTLYLGHHSRAGAVYRGDEFEAEKLDEASWNSGASSPIYATPTISNERMIVGTNEGYVYCIANI